MTDKYTFYRASGCYYKEKEHADFYAKKDSENTDGIITVTKCSYEKEPDLLRVLEEDFDKEQVVSIFKNGKEVKNYDR